MNKKHNPAGTPEAQTKLFVYYLNKTYNGKQYLQECLGKISGDTLLKVLKLAIEELQEDTNQQLKRLDKIFDMLGEKPSDKFDAPIKKMIQNACDMRDNPETTVINDIDIMIHMQLVEHVTMVAYRILKKLAVLLKYDEIKNLLEECFDESKDNDKLFYSIAKEYLGA